MTGLRRQFVPVKTMFRIDTDLERCDILLPSFFPFFPSSRDDFTIGIAPSTCAHIHFSLRPRTFLLKHRFTALLPVQSDRKRR
jgi:hypothetical protein